jgi:hypothetical protein
MKLKEINESEIKETNRGHRVLPSTMILNQNKEKIEELMLKIAKAHNVPVEDAAYALVNVFQSLVGGQKPD